MVYDFIFLGVEKRMKTKRIIWYIGLFILLAMVFIITIGEYYGQNAQFFSFPMTLSKLKLHEDELSNFFLNNASFMLSIGMYGIQFFIPTFILLCVLSIYGILVKIPTLEYFISMGIVLLLNIFMFFLIRDFNTLDFVLTGQTKALLRLILGFSVLKVLYNIYLKRLRDKVHAKFKLSIKARRMIWYLGIILLVFVTITITIHEYSNWTKLVINQNFTPMSNDVNFSNFFIENKDLIYSFADNTRPIVTMAPIIFGVVLLYGILAKINIYEYLASLVLVFLVRIITYFFIRDFHPDNFVLKEHIILMGKFMGLFMMIRIIYEFYLKYNKK